MPRILCLDFDGVCHSYVTRWKGATTISDPPVPGLFEFIIEAQKHFKVAIFSARSGTPRGREAMETWLKKWAEKLLPEGSDLEFLEKIEFPLEKPNAFITIDDRVHLFTGEWPAIGDILSFAPWNRKPEVEGVEANNSTDC